MWDSLQGWYTNLDSRVMPYGSDGHVAVYDEAGNRFVFRADGAGGFSTPADIDATLTQPTTSTFELRDDKADVIWAFDTAPTGGPGAGLVAKTDRNGNQLTYTWTSGRISQITDTQGRDIDLSYDGSDRLDGYTDSASREWSFTYDGTSGRIAALVGPELDTTSYDYDTNGQLELITTPDGRLAAVTYDAQARAVTVRQVTNPTAMTGPTTGFAYGTAMGGEAQVVMTDPNSNDTTYLSTDSGRLVTLFDADNNMREIGYSPTGKVANRTNALSAVFSFTYDSNDNLTVAAAPASGVGQTAASSRFSYQSLGHTYLPSSKVDADGGCQAFEYDTAGNVTDTYAGLTPSISGECDGQTSSEHWTQTYNPDGTVATLTDPNSAVTSYSYDSDGNRTDIDHPAPLGDETYTYDSLSRVATHTDGRGEVTGFTYDAFDRIAKITYNNDTLCTSTATCLQYGYDDDGNLTSRIDINGTTTFTYDPLGRVVAKQLPTTGNACSGGSAMTFGWDDANNLVSHCDATGTVTYTYDQRNLVVGMAEPGGSCAGTPTACTTFAYDDNGRRTSTTFPTTTPVTQSVTFDPAGNVTGIAASKGTGTLTDLDYAYTQATSDVARRQSVTDNVTGVTTSYTYDTAGRLTAAAESGSGSASWFLWL